MDLTTINPALIAASVAAPIAGMGWKAWQGKKKERQRLLQEQQAQAEAEKKRQEAEQQAQAIRRMKAEREARKSGLLTLRTDSEKWVSGNTGEGQLAFVAVGTAAAKQLPAICRRLTAANADRFMSDPLLAEADADIARSVMQAVPTTFSGRVLQLDLPLLPGGLKGKPVGDGLKLEAYWRADLEKTTAEWLTRIRRDAKTVCLLMLLSPGGSAVLGRSILERFSQEYPQAERYVWLYLDHKTDRREFNLPALLDFYGDADLVDGFIVADNRSNPTVTDRALSLLIPSLYVAPKLTELSQAGQNILPDLFRCSNVATIRSWQGWLPCYYQPAYPGFENEVPAEWHTNLSFAQIQAIHGIEEVLHNPSLQALALPAASSPQFIWAVAPIRPADYQTVAERVRRSHIAGLTPDVSISFSSIGEPLTPQSREAPITIISLLPTLGGVAAVKQLLAGRSAAIPAAPASSVVTAPVPEPSLDGRGESLT